MSSTTKSPTRVNAARGSVLTRVREIVSRRELLVNLVRLELRSKYKASALGFLWSLLNPAMYLVVFYIAFDVILGGGIPRFPIYLLSGLLCWNFFTTALNAGTGSIVAAGGLVKKVWFPREVLPLASVGAALVHFFLQSLVLVAALAILRHPVSWEYLTLLPVALFALVLLAASMALFCSAANVYLRDVAHFVELALLGWFWLTPIVYPFTNLIKAVHGHTALALLNPVAPIVLTFQRALYGNFHRAGEGPVMPEVFKFGWYARNLALVIVGGLVMLYISLRVFRRLDGNIAEELLSVAAAIEIDHLTKTFKLYREKHTSLKEKVLRGGRNPYQRFHALEDVSLEIQPGHTVGLLGHNGSGKSTLLKLMAGILQPTSGTVRTTGRMAALLELGAGFHPELTGRENVYLNGSILGMKTQEVDRVFDDVVGFAGLETFIDTPVKHYSSGMYIRLGFAVAVHIDPEILLVDEVLSVGDESFQRKCLDKVRAFQEEGRTIVVVTHNADLVRIMCDWGAALDHGRLVAVGDPNDVIRVFRERLMQGMLSDGTIDPDIARSELSPLWHKVAFADAEVRYATPEAECARAGEPVQIDVFLEAVEPTTDVVVALNIYASNGTMVYGTNTHLLGADLGTIHGKRRVTFAFDELPLLDGTYSVTLGCHTEGGLVYDSWEQRQHFEMKVAGRSIGIVNLPIHVDVEAPAVAAPRRAG